MEPFSNKKQSIILKPLEDGFYYAFNFENPTGIKLLTRSAAQRLASIINKDHIIDLNNDIDCSLSKSGLLSENTFKAKPDNKKFSVWLHVADACNLSCFYCYIPNLRKAVEPGLSSLNSFLMKPQDAIAIANKLVAYCKKNEIQSLHVKFAGGEPTLSIEVIEFFCSHIEKQSDVSVSFGIITNGVFISENIFPILLKYGFSLSISLDGYELTHDAIRFEVLEKQRHGTWSKIWKNIDMALSTDIKPYFLYTITPKNIDDVLKFSELVHGHGLGYRLSLIRSKNEYPLEIQDKIIKTLDALYVNSGKQLDTNLPIARYAKFSEWNLKNRKNIACSAGRKYISIDQNGNISSCQMNMNSSFGNILESELESSFAIMKNDSRLSKIAKPELRDGVCNRCEYFHVCAGGCPEHTIKSYGTVDVPSSWCRVYGALVPIYIESIAWQMLRKMRNTIELYRARSAPILSSAKCAESLQDCFIA
jgi:uncharacterized protein